MASYISFLTPADVQYLLCTSNSNAYRLMKEINVCLEAKGCFTRCGRVSTKAFCDRYGIDPGTVAGSIAKAKREGIPYEVRERTPRNRKEAKEVAV